LLLVLARIVAAWLYRVDPNPDGAVVHLMVRHVLAGEPWPVFFYGQSYMGSFEPLLSALVARVAGYSPFAVCFGTALLGLLAAFATAWWARRMGGAWAGAAAAAWMVLGPPAYLHYMAVPRGGYGALLAATAVTLALGSALLERELDGRPPRRAAYLLLGLSAGIGFWSHLLSLPAAAAVGLAFLLCLRGRAWRGRILLPTMLGFLAGSLPFWLWNVRHGWPSLGMSDAVAATPGSALHALGLLAANRLLEFLAAADVSPWWSAAVVAAHLLLVIPAWSAWRAARGATAGPDLRPDLVMVAAYLALLTLCFAVTPQYTAFRTPRYLLPLVPVLAWLAGVGCTRASRRSLRAAALAGLAATLAWQTARLPDVVRLNRRAAGRTALMRAAGRALQERGVTAAYASYVLYAINPLSDEKVICSDPKIERYPPYAGRIENDPAPAVIENLGDAAGWAAASGGAFTDLSIPGLRILGGFHPPPAGVREISAAIVAAATDSAGRDVRALLADRRSETALTDSLPPDRPDEVRVSFAHPVRLAGVRLWGVSRSPVWWEVEGRAEASDSFRLLGPRVPGTSFFWSGPRPYWAGPHERREARFEPATVREVVLRFGKTAFQPAFSVAEVQWLAPPEGRTEDAAPNLAPLLDRLRAAGVGRLYADRWIANQAYAASGGRLWTSRDPRLLPPDADPRDLRGDLRLDRRTAVLIEPAGESSLRETLAARGVSARETSLPGLGVLFDFPDLREGDRAADPCICFAGAYAMLTRDAAWAWQRARDLCAHGTNVTREAWERFLAIDPDCIPALRGLASAFAASGDAARSAELTARADAIVSPARPGPAVFGGCAWWNGCSATDTTVRAGGRLTVRHIWRGSVPEGGPWRVFVHFVGPGGWRFQDDHALPLLPEERGSVVGGRYVVDVRHVAVPPDAPPGRYDMRLGVYSAVTGRRLAVQSPIRTRNRALEVVALFDVTAP
jgi:hypothetical protein